LNPLIVCTKGGRTARRHHKKFIGHVKDPTIII
jgi:hypothetical protein